MKDGVHAIVRKHLTEAEPMPPWERVNLPRLESALNAPRVYSFGVEAYPSLAEKTAILLYSLIKNHPWENGNKRMGMVGAYLFSGLNNMLWDAPQIDIYITVTWTAASEARCYKQAVGYLAGYFEQRLRPATPAEALVLLQERQERGSV